MVATEVDNGEDSSTTGQIASLTSTVAPGEERGTLVNAIDASVESASIADTVVPLCECVCVSERERDRERQRDSV